MLFGQLGYLYLIVTMLTILEKCGYIWIDMLWDLTSPTVSSTINHKTHLKITYCNKTQLESSGQANPQVSSNTLMLLLNNTTQ